ncbi:hypothetical protein T4B_10873 [Trichinella pseudospiralis]|uniref:Uncharacterized protein n=1 Tax=Trichinella pseudospiralis TaxID=6337 RepID=A0A0V1IUG0_TRIPS|nr:hypothetical protein T4B_10873 [Trichinella pseudospiralis]
MKQNFVLAITTDIWRKAIFIDLRLYRKNQKLILDCTEKRSCKIAFKKYFTPFHILCGNIFCKAEYRRDMHNSLWGLFYFVQETLNASTDIFILDHLNSNGVAQRFRYP